MLVLVTQWNFHLDVTSQVKSAVQRSAPRGYDALDVEHVSTPLPLEESWGDNRLSHRSAWFWGGWEWSGAGRGVDVGEGLKGNGTS